MIAEDTVLAFVEFYGADGDTAAALDWHHPLRVGAADADGEVLRVAAASADVGIDVAHGPSGECMWVMGVVVRWEEYLGETDGDSSRLRTYLWTYMLVMPC